MSKVVITIGRYLLPNDRGVSTIMNTLRKAQRVSTGFSQRTGRYQYTIDRERTPELAINYIEDDEVIERSGLPEHGTHPELDPES